MNGMKEILRHPIFEIVADIVTEENLQAYAVGGYVRDAIMNRPQNDVDIVVVGNGMDLAKKVSKRLPHHPHVTVFKNFGTAMLRYKDEEIEFIGARKESYRRDSRNPIVENGTLEDDQLRRDFTVNALAVSLNRNTYGEIVDSFGGVKDIERRVLRTPLDPDVTFSDDPLRMMRAIRFSAQLGFSIQDDTFESIKRNKERIRIVSKERITEELNKMMRTPEPSVGWMLLDQAELLPIILPQLHRLKGVEVRHNRAHKEIFLHTMQVLDAVSMHSQNMWLRWAALLHDVGKPATKHFSEDVGWSFHGHEFVGSKMIPEIFKSLRLPLNEHMKYVQKIVLLHLRPIVLAQEEVTDSAVRRLLFEAGDDIDDLMLLCDADITSKNEAKVKQYLQNFELVRQKLKEIEEKDAIRNFQPPVTGEEIMATFGLPPCREIGTIKQAIKDAILDGIIPNEYEAARNYMMQQAQLLGLQAKIPQDAEASIS